MALPKYIDTRAPQYVRQAALHKPLPKFTPAVANVSLNPAGKTYLANRAGHAGFKGNLTPAAARAATTKVTHISGGKPIYAKTTAAKGGNKPTAAATAQDTLAQITQRYIASLLTPQQETARAHTSVDAEIAKALAGLRESTQAEQAQARQQAARAQQYAMALGSLRDMSGLQTEADYTNAARNIQGLGTGLTGTIAEAQQAEANQAAQQIAAATQGLGQAKGLDVEGMKNIAQYTGVTMPSNTLFGQAASHAAQSRLDQDTRAAKIGNIAQEYLQKGTEAQEELKRKRAALEATRPSLYQEALQGLQSGGRSDMATIISALALQNTASKTPSEIAGNEADTAATKSRVTGFVYDPKTGKQQFNKDGTPKLTSTHWLPPGSTTPQKIPSNQHISKDGTRLVPNATATSGITATKARQDANVKAGYTPDGKDVGPGFYWGKDNKPKKIPTNWMLDPNDPTNKTIIKNPNTGPQGSGSKDVAKQTQRLINTWSTKFDKEMDMENSAYAKDIQDPAFKELEGSIWVPKMPYAKARANLISRLPPSLRKNPQMLANINTSLKRIGYKIPKTTVTTTTKKTGKGGTTTRTTTKDWAGVGRGKAPGQA